MSETKAIVVVYDLPYPPEKVWRALTEPSLSVKWLMDNEIRPIVGHKFHLRAKPRGSWNGIVDCEVLIADPPSACAIAGVAERSRTKVMAMCSIRSSPGH